MHQPKYSHLLALAKATHRRRIFAGAIALVIVYAGLTLQDRSEPAPQPALSGDGVAEARRATVAGAQVFGPIPQSGSDEDEARVLARLEERRSRVGSANLPALAQTIVREANRHGIDPELVLAVIDVESSYYLQAVSPVGARGLMQVMPATGKEVSKRLELPWRGEESLFDPHLNVTLGVAYLGQLKQRFGDIEKSLAAYNWGPSRIDRYLRNGDVLPRSYVENVFTTYESTRRPKVSGS